jgi:hypothetical protein
VISSNRTTIQSHNYDSVLHYLQAFSKLANVVCVLVKPNGSCLYNMSILDRRPTLVAAMADAMLRMLAVSAVLQQPARTHPAAASGCDLCVVVDKKATTGRACIASIIETKRVN